MQTEEISAVNIMETAANGVTGNAKARATAGLELSWQPTKPCYFTHRQCFKSGFHLKTKMAYQLQAFPILYLNLGGELIYIIEQRLQAQKISSEKSAKGNLSTSNFCIAHK